MKSEKDRSKKIIEKRGRQILILACISILALACSALNAVKMRNALTSSTREYCDGITEQITSAIKNGINDKKTALVNVADSVSKISEENRGKSLNEFLKRKADILDFDALLLIDSQGDIKAMSVEKELDIDIQALPFLEKVQNSFLGETNMGFFDKQTLFYSAPVDEIGGVKNVLIGVRSKENMQSLLDINAFHGKTLSCIVGARGETILSPVDIDSFAYLENIFRDTSQGREAQELKMMLKNMARGKDGSLQFTDVKGNENFLAYNSLEINDWVLLTIVPINLVSGNISVYAIRTFLIVAVVFLLFMMLLLVIYRVYNESRTQLTRLAFMDSLTGGMNNGAFQMKYQKEIRKKEDFFCVIVLMNIKNFKMINEKFGFVTGSNILRYIYQTIEKHVDKNNGEFTARSEMDHFFICLREKNRERVQTRMDEIMEDINTFQDADCPKCQLSFSLGCYLAENSDPEINKIQDRARMATQLISIAEENVCIFYNTDIAEKLKREQELDDIFEESLERHEFEVYLQPKVSLKTHKPEGAEALIRWKHPKWGMISPADFIPLFEKNGKICKLDFYVFEEICKFYQKRKKEGKIWYPVSVNLSRYHFFEEGFLDKFYQFSQEYGLPKYSIEFELTESMFFDEGHMENIKKGIDQMHEMGFLCSMDDFGSGYSSLGLLKEFDVDTLKMDRSFFMDISSKKGKDIIQSVVDLASKLNVGTVAEGIEDDEQMIFLYSINCDTVQGFLFSRPLPMGEFEIWVSQFETE